MIAQLNFFYKNIYKLIFMIFYYMEHEIKCPQCENKATMDEEEYEAQIRTERNESFEIRWYVCSHCREESRISREEIRRGR